jgi:anti-sigma factor ChrR (cupin superfamily)
MSGPIVPDGLSAADLAALGEGLSEARLPAERKASLKERILRRIEAPPPALTSTLRAHEGEWVQHGPGDHRKLLLVDEAARMATFLLRLDPGVRVATHSHEAVEECLVLEGDVAIGEHRFGKGDFHAAFPGAVHRGFGTDGGCLLLIRAQLGS